jgi:hypothetical protein
MVNYGETEWVKRRLEGEGGIWVRWSREQSLIIVDDLKNWEVLQKSHCILVMNHNCKLWDCCITHSWNFLYAELFSYSNKLVSREQSSLSVKNHKFRAINNSMSLTGEEYKLPIRFVWISVTSSWHTACLLNFTFNDMILFLYKTFLTDGQIYLTWLI